MSTARWTRVGAGRGVGAVTGALVTAWAGAGCAALYFGAEVFGIRTIAEAALRDDGLGLLADIEALRMQPWAVTLFAAGLLLLAVSGVLVAVALWQSGLGRSGARAKWAGPDGVEPQGTRSLSALWTHNLRPGDHVDAQVAVRRGRSDR